MGINMIKFSAVALCIIVGTTNLENSFFKLQQYHNLKTSAKPKNFKFCTYLIRVSYIADEVKQYVPLVVGTDLVACLNCTTERQNPFFNSLNRQESFPSLYELME